MCYSVEYLGAWKVTERGVYHIFRFSLNYESYNEHKTMYNMFTKHLGPFDITHEMQKRLASVSCSQVPVMFYSNIAACFCPFIVPLCSTDCVCLTGHDGVDQIFSTCSLSC